MLIAKDVWTQTIVGNVTTGNFHIPKWLRDEAKKSMLKLRMSGGMGKTDISHPAPVGSGEQGDSCKCCVFRMKGKRQCSLLCRALVERTYKSPPQDQIGWLRIHDKACRFFIDREEDPLKLAVKAARNARRKEKEDAATQRSDVQ